MGFVPHTQEELKAMRLDDNRRYEIEYINKDYFNGEETIERAEAGLIRDGEKLYFNVTDPYGMEKMVMNVRIVES